MEILCEVLQLERFPAVSQRIYRCLLVMTIYKCVLHEWVSDWVRILREKQTPALWAQVKFTLLNHSGLFFLASANVEPNPAIIPADATVVRNAAPAHRKWPHSGEKSPQVHNHSIKADTGDASTSSFSNVNSKKTFRRKS